MGLLRKKFEEEIPFRFFLTTLIAGVAPLILLLIVIVLVTLGTNEPLNFHNYSLLSPFYRLITFVVLVSLTTALGVYIFNRKVAQSFLRPIKLLRQKDQQVVAGRLEESLVPEGEIPPDELGEVMKVRNQMIRKLAMDEEELVRSEKLAAIGQLSSSIAHELRNPFTVLQNAVGYLKLPVDKRVETKTQEYLDMIVRHVAQANQIIENLLHFARVRQASPQRVFLNELLREGLDQVRPPVNVKIVWKLDPSSPRVIVDPLQMKQVFVNLALNSFDAMREGGELDLTTTCDGSKVVVLFRDNGVGISSEVLPKIFQPLFSTKPKGTGLGLAISRQLVENNGGQIQAESRSGQGTLFVIELPLVV
ncbi:MAG: ATP-binding protein [Deltaproteobacteria bacterium]|nr:ATP-binding protein [Deltaproteobacteria bacterium]